MRWLKLLLVLPVLSFAQNPILYHRGTINAASYAPFGLPNAPIARGSVFSIFGENLGPASGPSPTIPVATSLGGVSISVIQNGTATPAYPTYVSPSVINAIMPSSVKAGLANLRITYNGKTSNAITIQIADAGPGIFTVSGGGYGPGIVQNYVDGAVPLNSSLVPATPGQIIIMWGTGLGAADFADNDYPQVKNIPSNITVTVGGQTASLNYTGRSPSYPGIDEVIVKLPANVPLGCWVPISVDSNGYISNTVTIAIAAPGASSCSDPGNPLSTLVRTPGTQAYVDVERIDSIDNVTIQPASVKHMDKLYTRFFTRPDSPFNFDPYMSYPPAGTCMVQENSGDVSLTKGLRGALPNSASLSPQPAQAYNNGTQRLTFTPTAASFSSTVAVSYGTPGDPAANTLGMDPLTGNAAFTVDPNGANPTQVPLALPAAPSWDRPTGLITIPHDQPLALSFTPGDTAAPTAITLYAYTAAFNATVDVQCLAPPGATSFTIPADLLARLPITYGRLDGSYANLFIGTLGFNSAKTFTHALAAHGLFLGSNWTAQAVVIQ